MSDSVLHDAHAKYLKKKERKKDHTLSKKRRGKGLVSPTMITGGTDIIVESATVVVVTFNFTFTIT